MLERAVVVLAIAALLYRAKIYHTIAKPAGAAYGLGDVIDFGLGLVLFVVACLCAASGIALMRMTDAAGNAAAYRPAVIGMTTFVVYYLVYPYIPAL